MRDTIRRYILDSPTIKTAGFVVGTIVTGVLCGTFVSEITHENKLQWSLFYSSRSFYGLLVIGVALFFYNREVYLYDRDIMRFKDTEFCIAYIRSKCLPAAVQMYEAKIRAGDIGELDEAMKEIRRILK